MREKKDTRAIENDYKIGGRKQKGTNVKNKNPKQPNQVSLRRKERRARIQDINADR